jgi:hypothetical protein
MGVKARQAEIASLEREERKLEEPQPVPKFVRQSEIQPKANKQLGVIPSAVQTTIYPGAHRAESALAEFGFRKDAPIFKDVARMVDRYASKYGVSPERVLASLFENADTNPKYTIPNAILGVESGISHAQKEAGGIRREIEDTKTFIARCEAATKNDVTIADKVASFAQKIFVIGAENMRMRSLNGRLDRIHEDINELTAKKERLQKIDGMCMDVADDAVSTNMAVSAAANALLEFAKKKKFYSG